MIRVIPVLPRSRKILRNTDRTGNMIFLLFTTGKYINIICLRIKQMINMFVQRPARVLKILFLSF
jgi:hypothetical protein